MKEGQEEHVSRQMTLIGHLLALSHKHCFNDGLHKHPSWHGNAY
jgi:hypothetical protein